MGEKTLMRDPVTSSEGFVPCVSLRLTCLIRRASLHSEID